MLTKDKETVVFIVKAHDYDVERITNMSLLKDLKRAAFLLGLPYSNKRKSALAYAVVNHVKKEME